MAIHTVSHPHGFLSTWFSIHTVSYPHGFLSTRFPIHMVSVNACEELGSIEHLSFSNDVLFVVAFFVILLLSDIGHKFQKIINKTRRDLFDHSHTIH